MTDSSSLGELHPLVKATSESEIPDCNAHQYATTECETFLCLLVLRCCKHIIIKGSEQWILCLHKMQL